MYGKHDHSIQAEEKGATMGGEWEEAWEILMEAESVLHMFQPGERPFGSSYSRSNKLEA